MDFETRIYKYSLMIGGAVLTILFLLCTIFCTFMGPEIGWGALMFVSMLISIGVFYIGWDTGRSPRSDNQEPENQETTDVEHHQES